MYVADFEAAAGDVFSDLPRAEGIKLVSQFPGHSTASFAGKLTYAAYKDVPVTYIICEEDKVISPKAQRKMVQMLERDGKDVTVVSLKSGHAPNSSQPEKVVEVVRKAAGEKL